MTFKTGQYVRHAKYGCGTIVERDEDRTVVDFDTAGLKKFVTSIAVFEIAEGGLPKRGAPRFVAAPRRLVNNLLAGACQLSAKLQPCCRHTLPFRDTMPKALAARRLQFTFPHFSSFFLRKCPHGCFSLNLPFKQLQFLIDIAFPLR